MKKLDQLEKSIKLIIFKLYRLINPKDKQVLSIDKKTKQLTDDYNSLINEFELIQQKKSRLSSKKRREVVLKIAFLIDKGHIKINQPQPQNNSTNLKIV